MSCPIGCVDTSELPSSDEGAGSVLEEPEPITLITTDPLPPELRERAVPGPYSWRNVAIKGGGFVTGIVFSRAVANLIYARTDVGGAYRWNVSDGRWVPLTDWIGQTASNWTGIESIAADPSDARHVYLAAGTYVTAGDGVMLHSEDYGHSWTRHVIPVPMGGNADGRSMGERLAVDPDATNTLYFGSRNRGLWTSRDSARTWSRVTGFPAVGDADLGLGFVTFDTSSRVYVGVATLSGPTLYRSADDGQSWEAVPGAPTGMMPHHAAVASDGVMYLVYNDGPGPNGIMSGAVWKLDTASDTWTNVSPRDCGFGGVSVDASRPGTVMVSTIDLWAPDEIYRSMDGGEHWRSFGGSAQRDAAGADWLYFGGNSLSATGWMGDIEIDPWNRSRVLHITGQGIWWTDNATDFDAALPTAWSFKDDGLEETVALDLASPPSGPPLLSALGDVAGFRHDDLDRSPPGGMFSNPRFGNTTSIDFAELSPSIVARVGTNDGGRRGAYSVDGGDSWEPFASEPAGNGSGTIAVSADGTTLLWSPQGGAPAYSTDTGRSWLPSSGFMGNARVAADRKNPNKFYAVDRTGSYVSVDGGRSFAFSAMELPRGARLRPVFGIEGDVWLVTSQGLHHSTDSAATFTRLANVQSALALGFGRPLESGGYPALYLSGTVANSSGIFRSDDAGATWNEISDEQNQFGWVGYITGDQRQAGRVYLGTGGRGILYGDPL